MKNIQKLLNLSYQELCKLRKEIRDSLIIEITGALFFLILQFLISQYDLPRYILDIYGIGLVVVLPFYILFKVLKRDRVIYRQTAAWMIFCLTLTPTAIIDNFISGHYDKNDLFLKLPHFLYLYIPSLISAPFNVFVSLLAYRFLTRFWPHSHTAI